MFVCVCERGWYHAEKQHPFCNIGREIILCKYIELESSQNEFLDKVHLHKFKLI